MSASSTRAALRVERVVETCINVYDIARARKFYESVFGFQTMYSDERLCELAVGGNSVLMLFARGQFTKPVTIPGGVVPPHDTTGAGHVAFAISADTLATWRARLRECEVAIESEVQWERGGTSLYFRDPDDNLLELATPGVWPNY
jgi:catechol 2,3-dioxygenase-like lactoylglutathione lyase family enzyme